LGRRDPLSTSEWHHVQHLAFEGEALRGKDVRGCGATDDGKYPVIEQSLRLFERHRLLPGIVREHPLDASPERSCAARLQPITRELEPDAAGGAGLAESTATRKRQYRTNTNGRSVCAKAPSSVASGAAFAVLIGLAAVPRAKDVAREARNHSRKQGDGGSAKQLSHGPKNHNGSTLDSPKKKREHAAKGCGYTLSMRWAQVLVAVGLLLGPPTAALAQPGGSTDGRLELAADAVRRGLSAASAGDFSAAVAHYRQAQLLAPEANLPYLYEGDALIQLERWHEAVLAMERYLELNPAVSDAAVVRERIALARSRLPGQITLRCEDTTINFSIDDGPFAVSSCPASVPAAPGGHLVRIRWENGALRTWHVIVDADKTRAVDVPRPEKVLPARSPEPRQAPASPWRTVGWVVAGTGVAALATAFVVDAFVLGTSRDEFDAAVRSNAASAPDLANRLDTERTVALVTYGAGAVLAAGGAAILIFGPKATDVKHVRAQPTLGGVVLQGRF
jgi:tetratricopeptide (TPR) repeat protein